MNILVTGSTGYLGSNFIRKYKNEHSFTSIKRKNKNSLLNSIDYEKIYDSKVIQNNLNKFDLLIIFSNIYESEECNNTDFIKVNLLYTMEIYNFSKKIKIPKAIFFDTTLNKKINRYSFSKKMLIEWFERFNHDEKLIIIKFDFMFGFNDKRFTDNLVKNLLVNKKKIPLTSGYQKRNFIYIEDLLISINSIILNSYKIKKITFVDLKSMNDLTLKKFVTLIINELQNQTNKKFHNRLLWNVLKKRLYENSKPTLNNKNTLRIKSNHYQVIEKSIKLLISHYVK
tara:strand:+ start:650 stop:1501 length:852 start_codon:yes stop_codon:yes gene_type:complete